WLNGTRREYHPAPNGSDASLSGTWSYSATGEFKLFAIDQRNRFGVVQELPDESGTYKSRVSNSTALLSWHDSFGRFSQTATFALGARRQQERFGAFDFHSDSDLFHVFTYAGYEAGERLTLRAGGEWERLAARFHGQKGIEIASRARDDRVAGFLEADWRIGARVKVTPGLRSDRASLPGQATFDPRLAAAWLLGKQVTVTFAAG